METLIKEFLQNKMRVLSLEDEEYPPLLKKIYKPPSQLFVAGKYQEWHSKIPIAFVGTREASPYGRKVIETLIAGLSELPIIVVSGFARGIDTFTHETALKFNLSTVGILGTGLDVIYPLENRKLFERMLEEGTLMSSFPLGDQPLSWHFPKRNQWIAGVSKTVIVVEAPEKSGALLTAEFAMEEGREVMAVPGNIFSLRNKGCHRLIGQGAKLVEKVEDILETLGLVSLQQNPVGALLQPKAGAPLAHAEPLQLNSEENILYQHLSQDPLHIDKLSEISNLAPSLVAGNLISLALKGLIEELPGKFFVKT